VIKELRRQYPVRLLCHVLAVSRSGYHAWLRREPSERATARERLKLAAQAAHQRTRSTYGAARLQRELAADGFRASLGTVKSVRRELGLRCVQQQKRFRVATTDSGHELPVAPNLLAQKFKVEQPDQVWTTDITYVPTAEGWLYVAAIKDLFAGEIVGRSFGARMTTDLIVRALEQAVATRRPSRRLIHHSDRGSQYCSHEYQALLRSYEMRVSMSRQGNCYDNAPIESFWGTLKTELVHHRRYQTHAEAVREISDYIDIFYNRQRRQARLGYMSPAACTQQFMRRQQAA
jgi:putative transposase